MKTISEKAKKNPEGRAIYYDEKKKMYGFHLTPTSIAIIDSKAKNAGVSRSEFLEQYARSLLPD